MGMTTFFREMLRRLLPLGLGLTVACSASTDTDGTVLLTQDVEGIVGWNNVRASEQDADPITTNPAHSGKYALRVGPGLEYGLTFKQLLGNLTQKRPVALALSYWCLASEEDTKATVVLALERPSTGKLMVHHATPLKEFVKTTGVWTLVTERVQVPAEVEFSDQLTLYPWRGASATATYFDDLEIRALYE